ncbi:MAG: imidazole glycerol phosphate synthase subunit HisH [Myxococcaceae bacterium]
MRLTLLDTGAGNLHSLGRALESCGATLAVETDPRRCLAVSGLVLPGVGAFAPAAERLASVRSDLAQALRNGLPCLAICLGLQLLLGSSEEGPGEGLGVLAGRVERLPARRVPHMGWNALVGEDNLLAASGLTTAYYAHSYLCALSDKTAVRAVSQHEEVRIPALVRTARTVGVQFHPEKSGPAGRRFLAEVLEELQP